MRKTTLILAAAAVLAFAVTTMSSASSASPGRNYLCWLTSGTFSSSVRDIYTPFSYTNQSYFESNHDYWAYRFRTDSTIAWSHLQDVSTEGIGVYGPYPWNNIDVVRRSWQNGTLGATAYIEQWAGTHCD